MSVLDRERARCLKKIDIFADTASFAAIKTLLVEKEIEGVTTNPTILKKDGVTDYLGYLNEFSEEFPFLQASFEVVSENNIEVLRQAHKISQISETFWVKVPIVNSKGKSNLEIINQLLNEGIKVNITAVFTLHQLTGIIAPLDRQSIVSVFAGRISDAGYNAQKIVADFVRSEVGRNFRILWASSRQAYNVVEATESGADIITISPDLINKTKNFGKDLKEFSRETSKMFIEDAEKAGLSL